MAVAESPAPVSDWTVRGATPDDLPWLRATLAAELAENNYFHGIDRAFTDGLAEVAFSAGWGCLIVSPADEDDPAGWVLFKLFPDLVVSHVMVPSVAMAYVEPAYRGLGAWRALRERVGLRDGQLVNIVLAGPAAMYTARKKYKAKHHWGRVLEWLA